MAVLKKKLTCLVVICLIACGGAWVFWPVHTVEIKPVESSSVVSIARDDSPSVFDLSDAIDEIVWGPNSKTLTIHTKSTKGNRRSRPQHLLEFSLETQELRNFFSTKETLQGLALTGDGAAIIGQWRTGPNDECQILTIDRQSGREVGRLDGAPLDDLGVPFTSDTTALAISPDGRFIAAGTKLVDNGSFIGAHIGGEVCLWNREKKLLHWKSRTTHTDIVYAVAFSLDSKTLASAGQDNLIRFWNVETGDLIRTLVGAAWDGIVSIAWSPDGKYLASGGMGAEDGGAVRIWDVENGKMLHRFALFRARTEVRLVCSHDGRLFATGLKKDADGNQFQVHAWNIASGEHIGMLAEGAGAARTIAVSPDGRLLALGTNEGSLLVFDLNK